MSDTDYFPNYAGRDDIDDKLIEELQFANIEHYKMPEALRDNHPEMRTVVVGDLVNWHFKRNWYYWVATGTGIPPVYANKLHETHGQYVRVDGHCGCPSPLEWFKGFGVGHYHVDTFAGLKALADTIRLVLKDAANNAAVEDTTNDTN